MKLNIIPDPAVHPRIGHVGKYPLPPGTYVHSHFFLFTRRKAPVTQRWGETEGSENPASRAFYSRFLSPPPPPLPFFRRGSRLFFLFLLYNITECGQSFLLFSLFPPPLVSRYPPFPLPCPPPLSAWPYPSPVVFPRKEEDARRYDGHAGRKRERKMTGKSCLEKSFPFSPSHHSPRLHPRITR